MCKNAGFVFAASFHETPVFMQRVGISLHGCLGKSYPESDKKGGCGEKYDEHQQDY